MVRAFIAVEISDELRGKIAASLERLRTLQGIKWVDPENMHLTLRFLGDITDPQVETLKTNMGARFTGASPVSFRLRAYGRFPRVVWVGIEGDLRGLRGLWERAQASARELGLPKDDHDFSPHVTVGRIKQPVKDLDKRLASLGAPDFGSMTVSRVTLFQSELGPDGPTYTPLFDTPLIEIPR